MTAPYRGPVIDPHHHLWDLSLGRHPWLAPERGAPAYGSIDAIRRDYLPADYRRDAARQHVVATVHVEAGWRDDDPLGETRWLENLELPAGIASRFVAHVPLAHPMARRRLEAEAAHRKVVGIRDIVSWDPDPAKSFALAPGMMDYPIWRRGLAALEALGLAFDLMLYPPQMPEALRLARDFPAQTFVVNHCGSPADRSPAGMRLWADGLAALGREPNVFLKLSDPVAYDPGWTMDSIRAVVLACIEWFGPERAMFASDFPVTGLHASFDAIYDAYRTIVADFPHAEQAALFFDTANRVYRLGLDRSAFPDGEIA